MKKLITLLLFLMTFISVLTFAAFADDEMVIAEGSCGKNITPYYILHRFSQ